MGINGAGIVALGSVTGAGAGFGLHRASVHANVQMRERQLELQAANLTPAEKVLLSPIDRSLLDSPVETEREAATSKDTALALGVTVPFAGAAVGGTLAFLGAFDETSNAPKAGGFLAVAGLGVAAGAAASAVLGARSVE